MDLSTLLLFFALLILVLVSGFFSAAETGIMATNRYRLQHLVQKNHRAAKRLAKMLIQPDRILGVILIANTFANILSASIATMIAVRFLGDAGVLLATLLLTFFVLVFAEVTPKTLAALFPERVAFFVSLPIKLLLGLLYPLIWLINGIARALLSSVGIKAYQSKVEPLSQNELRSLLLHSKEKIPAAHQAMLLGILDLDSITVNDIMVPRHEILGINIQDDWSMILKALGQSQYIRLLVYKGSLDQVYGFTHSRKLLNLLSEGKLERDSLMQSLDPVHYIPEGTSLRVQLFNFQHQKYRIGIVVDEYGDFQGLVTLSDILEEIVGEFCTDLMMGTKEICPRADGTYIIDGDIAIRDLNRTTGWDLPSDGPNTLSGLIIEKLEMIPNTSVGLRLGGYPVEVLRVHDNKIVKAKVMPRLYARPKEE